MWVEQWPLTQEKLSAAETLVFEQLKLGHIEPSNSPWNTPIFVIKKKSGKWRLLQDLRKINETMEDMGALQPGLLSPVAIPKNYHIMVIDLQDCFFTIPLASQDRKRFAFSLPSVNLQRPYRRFQWKVLPQGMKKSPTLCQKFVDMALQSFRKKFSQFYIIHYMDDILLAYSDLQLLQKALSELISELLNYGLKVAPEKNQTDPPYNYLGRLIYNQEISPQKLEIRTDQLKTLNDFQKLLGDINWIRPFLKITTKELKLLFDILCGEQQPTSSRVLTQEAKQALRIIEQKLNNLTLLRLDYTKPFSLILLNTEYTPTRCLWQEGPLEWLHLPVAQKRVLVSYPDLVALLLYKGRQRAKELFGKEPNSIIVPYTAQQLDILLMNNDQWQICYSNYKGQTLYHLPNHPLLQFIKTHPVFCYKKEIRKSHPKHFHRKFSITPLPPPASLVFTDGSSNGTAAYIIDGKQFSTQYPKQSAQKVELLAVMEVFSKLTEKEFNLYTDSMYIVNLFPHIESAPLSPTKSTIHNMLAQLQTAITQRAKRFFVGHIRAHRQLPGSLQEGNTMADKLTQQIFSVWEEAKQSHAIHHQNSRALALQFNLTREQARQIVKQ